MAEDGAGLSPTIEGDFIPHSINKEKVSDEEPNVIDKLDKLVMTDHARKERTSRHSSIEPFPPYCDPFTSLTQEENSANTLRASASRAFGGRSNKGNGNNPQANRGLQLPANGTYQNSSPALPSPTLPAGMPMDNSNLNGSHMPHIPPPPRKPFFFREEYAGLIVKGNFMTLAAKPVLVEKGEWIAHQVVEQYRLLDSMVKIVQEYEPKIGQKICNPQSCPTMSAGTHTYAWLDQNRKPIPISASQYITFVQKWISGRINDPKLFPTDIASPSGATHASGGLNTTHANSPIPAGPTTSNAPLSELVGRDWLGKTSGFPENFEREAQNIYRQMFRLYAHLYHGHWLDPFYHIDAYRELNTCFVHFVNVGKLFDLFHEQELEPMQPLIDIWIANGQLPPVTASGTPASATSTSSAAA